MLRALVVDDEFPSRQELIAILENNVEIEVIGECEDGDEILKFLAVNKVDVIFLDINMRIQDGLSVAEDIQKQLDHPPMIVFTTGFSQYALNAFEVNAIDYILKPYSEKRVKKTVEKISLLSQRQNIENTTKEIKEVLASNIDLKHQKLPVWQDERLIIIHLSDVFFAKADGKRTTMIVSKKGNFTTKLTLKELEEKLPQPYFMRTHKSFIVNLEEIQEIVPWFNQTYNLKLEGCEDYDIPVAQKYKKEFNVLMGL